MYNLDLSASIGYYDLKDDDYSKLHDGKITASMVLPINDNLSMTPSFHTLLELQKAPKIE
jgi:hypothetical protein